VLYVNRGLVFEQRASGNQLRATSAFETAEAGLEWAIARLNDGSYVVPGSTCAPVASSVANAVQFRDLYAPNTSTGFGSYNYTPLASSRAACSVGDNGEVDTCTCPSPSGTVTLATPGTRNFRVSFLDTPDPEAIRVTSHGCTNPTGVCDPSTPTNREGAASVTVIVKRIKGTNGIPNAALITGGWAMVCSSFNISSTTATCTGGSGQLVNSGSQIRIGNNIYRSGTMPGGAPTGCGNGTSLDIPDGTPIAAAMAPNDPRLNSLASNADAMFFAVFGQSKADYQASVRANGCWVTGASAIARASSVLSLYGRAANPCTRFWLDGDADFNGNVTLGSAANNTTTPPTPGRQVVLASDSALNLRGGFQFYGLIYVDNVSYGAIGTGTSDIYGTVIARNNYQNTGNGSIHYDQCGLSNLLDSGYFEKVPGSWIDDVSSGLW
jgi:hypothetical protein